jgi:CHASE2 domain-containing sensor protein
LKIKKLKSLLIIFIAFKAIVFLVSFAYEKKFFQIFNIDSLATEDIQLNDIYYSINHKFNPDEIQKDIVLVNTGSIENDENFRTNLALLIDQINEYGPKNIGVDIVFEVEKDNFNDSILKETIARNNVVTAYDFKQKHKNLFQNQNIGVVNFPARINETIRQYYNYVLVGKDTIPSFACALIKNYPNQDIEYIKYSSKYSGFYNFLDENSIANANNFPAIEARDFLDDANTGKISDLLKDKYVIIGHLGADSMHNANDFEDKFKVPTDSILFNRIPIMPGCVIHANAAQMHLNNEHILSFDGWPFEVLSALILFGYLFIFFTIKQKSKLSKIYNVIIIIASTLILIFIANVYLMDIGVYVIIGGLYAQIALIEGFIDIEEEFHTIFNKNKKNEVI